MEKKLKQEDVEFTVTYELHNKNLQELSTLVDGYKERYPKHKNWRFIVESGWEHTNILLTADRWETDKEMKARANRSVRAKEAAKKRKLKKELLERKLLKDLQEKYGK